MKFHERNIMDDISYREQTDKLRARLTELRGRRMKLLADNENEKVVDDLRRLKEILQESPRAIVGFDERLFERIVEKIKVGHDGTLTFVLGGGLALRERMEVTRKCA